MVMYGPHLPTKQGMKRSAKIACIIVVSLYITELLAIELLEAKSNWRPTNTIGHLTHFSKEAWYALGKFVARIVDIPQLWRNLCDLFQKLRDLLDQLLDKLWPFLRRLVDPFLNIVQALFELCLSWTNFLSGFYHGLYSIQYSSLLSDWTFWVSLLLLFLVVAKAFELFLEIEKYAAHLYKETRTGQRPTPTTRGVERVHY